MISRSEEKMILSDTLPFQQDTPSKLSEGGLDKD